MFNINIPFYAIAIILALLSNIILVLLNSQKSKNFNNREIIGLLLYENVGIIVGAKILYFILNYEKLNGNFEFISLGFTAYGAVIGALVFVLLFCFQFKKELKETIYIVLPSLPLMYSISKLGCFLVGCCYGIEYNGFGKIMYQYSNETPNNVYLFPVQLIESILFLIIFIYIKDKQYKNKFNITTVGNSLILCGITKFLLDFLRMSHKNIILSFNQCISILFIIISIMILLKYKKSKQS